MDSECLWFKVFCVTRLRLHILYKYQLQLLLHSSSKPTYYTNKPHSQEFAPLDKMALKLTTMLVFAILLVLESANRARARTPDAVMVKRHEKWMVQHRRTYKDETEKAKRFKTFKKNVRYIHSVNKAGTRSYKLAVNKFADMTNEDFQALHKGYKMRSVSKPLGVSSPFRYVNVTAVPRSMDWRKKGAVTGVKEQGKCGKSNNTIHYFSREKILNY